MNKLISKKLFVKNKIKTPNYISIKKNNYKKNSLQRIINNNKIKYPFVLKPTNEGSSLGVEIM